MAAKGGSVSKYSDEQKLEFLAALERGQNEGKTTASIARELGVTAQALYFWRENFKKYGSFKLPPEELERRRQAQKAHYQRQKLEREERRERLRLEREREREERERYSQGGRIGTPPSGTADIPTVNVYHHGPIDEDKKPYDGERRSKAQLLKRKASEIQKICLRAKKWRDENNASLTATCREFKISENSYYRYIDGKETHDYRGGKIPARSPASTSQVNSTSGEVMEIVLKKDEREMTIKVAKSSFGDIMKEFYK